MRPHPDRPGPPLAAPAGIALVLCAGFVPQALALRVHYAIDLQAERNDNVLLTADEAVESDILLPGIGFLLRHDSSSVRSEVSGRIVHRQYRDDSFDSTTDASMRGFVDWTVVPERLSFSVADNLSLQPVDTFAADAPGNRQQVNVFSAGPSVLFRWSPSWRGAADLRWIRSDAEITDEFDSQRVLLALRSETTLGETGVLSLNAQTQRVDFENDLVARDYRRHDLYLRYARTLARFDLSLDLGWSQLDYRQPRTGFADGRDDPLLRAEAAWRPNANHRIGLDYAREFSDVTGDALYSGEVAEPGDDAPPPPIVTGDTVVNASPYLDERLRLRYEYASPRLNVDFTPQIERLRYGDSDTFDQNGHGAGLELEWRARRTLFLGVSAGVNRIEYVNLDRTDSNRRFGAHVRYAWTRNWSASVSASRYARRSTDVGVDAEQTLFAIGVTYANR